MAKNKFLIIEDQEELIQYMEMILQKNLRTLWQDTFEILSTPYFNEAEIFIQMQGHEIGLVLLDQEILDSCNTREFTNSDDLLPLIKSINPNCKVVSISSDTLHTPHLLEKFSIALDGPNSWVWKLTFPKEKNNFFDFLESIYK